MKKVLLLFLMCISFGLTAQTNYHVTTTGSSSGDGSISNPLDIATAFDRYHTPEPGANDTLFIHGGTYVANLHVWFGGTSSGDVTITNYNGERVIIDGNTGVDDAAIIYIQAEGGGYVTIDGLEIMDSNTNRWTNTTGSFPPYPQNKLGIQSASDNYTIRNCIIHDVHGNGVGGYGGNGLIENNIMFYNGWESTDRGHCYGIYAQNDDPAHFVKCYNNIIFKNFGAGFHMYVTNATSISNLFVKDNIAFESGTLSTNVGENIFIGGLAPLDNIEVTYNHAYFDQETTGNSFRVGYYDQPNNNILVDNNYAIGGLVNMSLRYMTNLTLTNNFLSGGDYVYGQTMSWYGDAADKNTYSINNNEYHYKGSRQDYLMGTNWTGWQSFGFDLNGIMSFSEPTGSEYFLKYYPGANWATLIVYNWDNAGTIPINLSSVLSSGDDYEIYDVENIFGSAIASGTYTGGTVNVYTNGTTVTPVIGVSTVTNPPVHTSYKMGAFIVKSSALGSGGSTSPDPDPAPIVTFSADPLVIDEGNHSVMTATLSEVTTENVNVGLLASGGGATVNVDYTFSSPIVIPAGSLTGSQNFYALTDALTEGVEYRGVSVVSVTGGNATEHSTPQTAWLTINDVVSNPEPVVTLSSSPSNISEEGGVSTITALLSETTTSGVTVTIAASGGTASGADYNLSSTSIIIPTGSLSATCTLTGLTDAIYEEDETVDIEISNVSGGNATEHTTPQITTITIQDDESAPIVSLSAYPLIISEENGVSNITATVIPLSTSDITIELSVTEATATSEDYNLSSTTIIIPAGSSSSYQTLTGLSDIDKEGSHSVNISIASVSGGNSSEHPTLKEVSITLTDDDGSNDIDNLNHYALGKSHTWTAGETGYDGRIGVFPPIGRPHDVYIRLTSTSNIPGTIYYGTNPYSYPYWITPTPVVWMSDGEDGFYYELDIEAEVIQESEGRLFFWCSNTTPLTEDVTVTLTEVIFGDLTTTELVNAITGLLEQVIVNIEYISPEQHSNMYGTIYRVYLSGENLPSFLTAGNNISKLITFGGEMKTATTRSVFNGVTVDKGTSEQKIEISLTGTIGKGNLYWDNSGFSVISGYVDYCK